MSPCCKSRPGHHNAGFFVELVLSIPIYALSFINKQALHIPQLGSRDQTREQRLFIINQSLGITRSQGA